MENFLSRLNRNPYAPIDGASVTKFDELGNGLDDWGNVIAPRFEAPEQTWGETALGVATAPARLATALAGSLSPYGADGWQVPPIVNEGVNALTAVGDAYNYGMTDDEINSRALGMAGFMMGGGGIAARPAGGTGMFAGRLAKTADQEALARAERLAAEGADRNAIWNETGWFQGPDQKWRFEIDDSGAALSPKASQELTQGYNGDGVGVYGATQRTARGFLDHASLYEAYPSLADVDVRAAQNPRAASSKGSYDHDRQGIHGGRPQMEVQANSLDNVRSVALHEFQHGVQDLEGFLPGSSPNAVPKRAIDAERERLLSQPESNGWDSVGTSAPDTSEYAIRHAIYKRLPGEMEARNVQARRDMTPEQRRATPPWEFNDIFSNASKEGAVPAILAGHEAAPLRGYHGSMYPDYLDTAKKRGEFWAASDPSYDGIPVNSANPERLYSFFEGSTGQTAYPSMTPVEMQFKNPLMAGGDAPSPWTRVPFEGGQASTEDIVKLARERGNDGVIFKNLQESGPVSDEYVALGQGTVRSPLTGETLFSNADSKPALLAGALGQEQKGITAYHGSPHDFDKFDLSKIGTGEGAQAYGHGLYFAENEGVARNYREALADGYKIDGNPFNASTTKGGSADIGNYAADALSRFKGDRAAAVKWLREGGSPSETRAAEMLEKAESVEPWNGRMYQVRINADPNDFLDWDKPLSQQSEKVRQAMAQAAQAEAETKMARRRLEASKAEMMGMKWSQPDPIDPMSLTGADLWDRVPENSGIPGTRYLDQMSRDAGDGSYNYAVWDDSLIEILKKYGWLVPGAGYGANALSQSQENQY